MAAKSGLGLEIDSVGTHGYHVGEPPDQRAIDVAKARGIDMSSLRARKLEPVDFERFDHLIAMDRGHFNIMANKCPVGQESKLELFLNILDGHQNKDVPDPYYGDIQGFKNVFDLIEMGCTAWLKRLQAVVP